MKRVKAVYKDRAIANHRAMRQRAKEHQKKKEREESIRQEKLKAAKKRLHKILGEMKMKKDGKASHR